MRRFQRVAPKQPINEDIRHKELRVVSELGQFGVISLNRALDLARQHKTDLVVISENSKPPVAKLLDANKYFYEQKKREKETAKKQRENAIVIKEMQFRLGIGDNDFDIKLKNIEKFLNKGNKVKCVIRYKGRENANKQVGFEVLQRIIDNIENSQWEYKPNLNGNRLIGILMRKEWANLDQ